MADKKYTLTFAMSDGTEKSVQFTVPEGPQGPQGIQGEAANAVTYTPQDLTEEQTAQVQRNIGINELCPAFTESGDIVACKPVRGYPLEVVSKITPFQSGSGAPLPNNIRPISGYKMVSLTVNDETFTTDLGQEVYGGHLNWNTGVLTIEWYFEEIDGVNKKFGNRYAWDNIVQYPVTMQYGQSSALEGNIICSHFVNRNSTADKSCYSYEGGNKDIIVSMYDFATLEEANAWLVEQKSNGTPLTFCYEMYEPITIQLTPQDIIALSGTNILSSNTGITEVTGRANPVAIINNLQDRIAALEAAIVNNA